MCTIGGVIRDGRTYLLKNFDYPPVPTGWSLFTPFNGGNSHFALVDHGQRGVNSGLNEAGFGLQISRSKSNDPDSEDTEELRTVLNAELLTGFSSVGSAVEHAKDYVSRHPQMYGGNLMMADEESISVMEYIDGKSRSEVVSDGYLARANHSIFGLMDNAQEGSIARYEEMDKFVRGLHSEIVDLECEEIISRCREVLRRPPILNPNTRSSFSICIELRRVDYVVGDGEWRVFQF
jgi:hypothetical protein